MSYQSNMDQSGRFRLRIQGEHDVQIEGAKSKGTTSVEIYVDGTKMYDLSPVERGQPLRWTEDLSCDVLPKSRLALKIYEKRSLFWPKCVGTIEYSAMDLGYQATFSAESENHAYTSTLTFPILATAIHAYDEALVKAESMEKGESVLNKLGKTRSSFKAILGFGAAVAELHPTAKLVFALCTQAWEELEKQEECDDHVEILLTGLARMLPLVESIQCIVRLNELKRIITSMLNLVEDASKFIIKYRSNSTLTRTMRGIVDSKLRDQVDSMLKRLEHLRKDFDTGMLNQIVHDGATSAETSLLEKLNPIGSASYDSANACLLGTRERLIKDVLSLTEAPGNYGKLLWIYGQAGLGKSAVAASVCHVLDGKNSLISSFFCKRDDAELRDPQRVLNTIIHDLTHYSVSYRKAVVQAIRDDSKLLTSSMQVQFDRLVKNLAEFLMQAPTAGLCVLVDGLDECGTSSSRRLLLTCLQTMSKLVPWLKIIITSRPDKDIQNFFNRIHGTLLSQCNVQSYSASQDIRHFISLRLSKVLQENKWPSNTVDRLSDLADNLFIWAQTACTFILAGSDPTERLSMILNGTPPEGSTSSLDLLYSTAIKNSMDDGGQDNIEIVRQCLGAIVACSVHTPLSISSLEHLLNGRIREKVLFHVVSRLTSVLYIDDMNDGVIRVYHPSFADYLANPSRSGEYFVDINQRNAEIADCCIIIMLKELRFNLCRLETSHAFNRDIEGLGDLVESSISRCLRYSCVYWISHLTAAPSGVRSEVLREFLFGPALLFWMEALSLLGMLSVASSNLPNLVRCFPNEMQDFATCANDAYRFVSMFYDAISESTPHLYVSALALAPVESEIFKRLQGYFPNMIKITRAGSRNWPAVVRSISHPGQVLALAISHDGRRIVSGSSQNTLHIWDAETGAILGQPLVGHSGAVQCVAFSPDNSLLVSGSLDYTLRFWDGETGVSLGKILVGHSGSVNSVAFLSNTHRVVSGSSDQSIRIWDIDTCALIGRPIHVADGASVAALALSPDGMLLGIATSAGLFMRDGQTYSSVELVEPRSYDLKKTCIAFSPNSREFVTGRKDNCCTISDSKNGTEIAFLSGNSSPTCVAFSLNGHRILSGSSNGELFLWNAETKERLGQPLLGHTASVNCVAFSPDSRRIFSGSDDETLRIWDGDANGELEAHVEGHYSPIMSVAFSSDSRRIIASSEEDTRVWCAMTGAAIGQPVQLWRRKLDPPVITFSPDQSRFISISARKVPQLCIVDTTTGTILNGPLAGPSRYGWIVAFSPDSRRIATDSPDNCLAIWDAVTGAALNMPLKGHTSSLTAVTFSPNSLIVVSGSADGTIQMWDVETGVPIGTPLLGHSGAVQCLAFSPNGRMIVSGSSDKTLRVWDADRTACAWPLNVSQVPQHSPRNGWVSWKNAPLLLWIPTEYWREEHHEDSLLVISANPLHHVPVFDFLSFVHGESWARIGSQDFH